MKLASPQITFTSADDSPRPGGEAKGVWKRFYLKMLDLDVNTVSGAKLGDVLDHWETSDRRSMLREELYRKDSIEPDEVIMSPEKASERGLTSTNATR